MSVERVLKAHFIHECDEFGVLIPIVIITANYNMVNDTFKNNPIEFRHNFIPLNSFSKLFNSIFYTLTTFICLIQIRKPYIT